MLNHELLGGTVVMYYVCKEGFGFDWGATNMPGHSWLVCWLEEIVEGKVPW
jgi:hypothetical protein